MEDQAVNCPYCGEIISILLDYSGDDQNYYEDCSVCCHPILFEMTCNQNTGEKELFIKREDD